jgi:hypothetical protein
MTAPLRLNVSNPHPMTSSPTGSDATRIAHAKPREDDATCLPRASRNQEGEGLMRLLVIFLGLWLAVGNVGGAWAASDKAVALRQANNLVAFTPSEKFLSGNFVAEEMNPAFIFGPVKKFAGSRKYPTTWLIEAGDKNLPAGPGGPNELAEYTLYLEEDCPNKVVYYVFIDQSGLTPQQWYEWRAKFHGKTKTEPEFSDAKAKLDKACTAGCGISGELRFIQKNGKLLAKSPEKVLRGDLKFAPIYDLSQQKKISK